jgi:mono/diheme cytochrome c family protein
MKILILTALAATASLGIGYADHPQPNVAISVPWTPPGNGRQMYMSYCAPCHGVYGRGNGPVAPHLRKQPVDLSALSKSNGGRFPAERVKAALRFGATNSPRATAQMPVWGPILAGVDNGYSGQFRGTPRIIILNQYLESLQAK